MPEGFHAIYQVVDGMAELRPDLPAQAGAGLAQEAERLWRKEEDRRLGGLCLDTKEKIMYDFIPSRTVREYAERTRHLFSDMDNATILYHTLPWSERAPALRELAARTEDAALRKQIEERLTYEELLRERFETNDGSFFYAVAVEDGADEITVGHYASVEAALAAGRAGERPFCISKFQLADLRRELITPKAHFSSCLCPGPQTQAEPYFGWPVAEYRYDAESVLWSRWSEETTPEERDRAENRGSARFEERFLFLPNPFELGDIVCMTGCPDQVGVVETSQESWKKFLERVRTTSRGEDFCDASITVEFLTEDGAFSHDHIPPIFLERDELSEADARKPLLKAASRLIRGAGALDELFRARKSYLAAAGWRR